MQGLIKLLTAFHSTFSIIFIAKQYGKKRKDYRIIILTNNQTNRPPPFAKFVFFLILSFSSPIQSKSNQLLQDVSKSN